MGNKEVPEEGGDSVKAPIQPTFTDARKVAVFNEKGSSRLEITCEETGCSQGDRNDLSHGNTTLGIVSPRKRFKKIVNMAENGDDSCLHVSPQVCFFVAEKILKP
jgi:hypothetical protein